MFWGGMRDRNVEEGWAANSSGIHRGDGSRYEMGEVGASPIGSSGSNAAGDLSRCFGR